VTIETSELPLDPRAVVRAPVPPATAKDLLAAYQRLLDFEPQLEEAFLVQRSHRSLGRHLRVLRLKVFLRYFLYVHMDRTLACLYRRYSARAALGAPTEDDDAQAAAIAKFRMSLPNVPKQRTVVFFVGLASLVVTTVFARVVLVHVYDPHLASPLGKVTLATLLVDRARFLDALPKFHDPVNGATALVLLALTLWLLLVAPMTSFRLKRTLFNLEPRTKEEVERSVASDHVRRSAGLYALERDVFAAAGARAPREMSFDLFVSGVILIPLVVLGIVLAVVGARYTVERRGWDAFVLGMLVAVVLLVPMARIVWAIRVGHDRARGEPVVHPERAYASWKRRLAAQAIDSLAIVGFAFVLYAVLYSQMSNQDVAVGLFFLALAPLVSTLLLLAIWVIRPRRRGQSLGKMALGIRTVPSDGEQIGLGRWIVRDSFFKWFMFTCVGIWFLAIPWLANFLWPAYDPQRRTFHDVIAGTHVIRR
jgi:uncharacterized RDD family membrane protein YckC